MNIGSVKVTRRDVEKALNRNRRKRVAWNVFVDGRYDQTCFSPETRDEVVRARLAQGHVVRVEETLS